MNVSFNKAKMNLEPIIDESSYFQRKDGLYLPSHYYNPDFSMPRERPTGIDLFCGAGGFSLGFIKAGWDVIAALEWDPVCIQTYLCNLGAYPVNMVFIEESDRKRMEKYLEKSLKKTLKNKERSFTLEDVYECGSFMSGSNRHHVCPEFAGVKWMFVGDARKISGMQMLEIMGLDLGEVDCVFGGPPCQGFSTSNIRRNMMDPRNSLVLEFARFVCEIKPKTCIMENVPGMLQMVTPEGIPVVDAICKILSDGNYGEYDTLRKTLLSTSGCGAMIKGKSRQEKKKREYAKRQSFSSKTKPSIEPIDNQMNLFSS